MKEEIKKQVKFDLNVSIIGTSTQDDTNVDWMQSARDRHRFLLRI